MNEQVGRAITPVLGSGEELRIDELGPRGERVNGNASLRATLTVSPSECRFQVSGSFDGEDLRRELPTARRDYDASLTAMLSAAGVLDRWDAARRALLVRFEEASAAERRTLDRSLTVERPTLNDLGAFDPAKLDALPLRPRTRSDASRWAEWRLLDSLSGYPTDDALDANWKTVADPFADLVGARPSRAVLTAQLRGDDRPPAKYWQLQAPTDWDLATGGET
ncbi:MAG: hypothetical protein JNK05_13410 [Myxococcales bacterium]|nr:hypothetical protein [Myxococcales bacterium]